MLKPSSAAGQALEWDPCMCNDEQSKPRSRGAGEDTHPQHPRTHTRTISASLRNVKAMMSASSLSISATSSFCRCGHQSSALSAS
eukprot:1152084-Pelagomonas_calceolata.AAC.14